MDLRYIKALHLPHSEQYFRDVVAVKSTGTDSIRGYLALWGTPDLTDMANDFFTGKPQKNIALPATDFWDSRLALPKPLTWDHAQDPETKDSAIIGQISEMGDDDIGRWYKAQLDRNHKFRKAIDALISQHAVGTSSDSAPQYVIRERTKSGANWLKQWPLLAGSLTPTPCEPRMLDESSLFAKSVARQLAKPAPRLTIAQAQRKIAELKAWAAAEAARVEPWQPPAPTTGDDPPAWYVAALKEYETR